MNGQLPACTAPDDFTVEFRFAAPNFLFLEQLASSHSNEMTHYPAHHFQKFHPKHNPEGAAELVRETKLPWATAFRTVYTPWNWHHAGIPTIDAWMTTNSYVAGADAVEATRNPYYWKVDTRGRQLPYLDRVRFDIVADDTAALQRVLEGKVDYQRQDFSSINATARQAILAAEHAGIIDTVRVIPSRSNTLAICLNLTHQDPEMRAALSNKNVRIALSEAINRQALITELYGGEGKPWQVAPRPNSPFFNRRLGEQFTAFAPEHSAQLLNEAGLQLQGADGLRHLADGRPFRLKLLVLSPGSAIWKKGLSRLQSDWRAIGVAMEWAILAQDEFYGRIGQNQHDGAITKGPGGYAAILEPELYVPATFENSDQTFYAVPWARWFINAQTLGAEKPPASVEKQMKLFRQVTAEPNRETRTALMAQVLEMAADAFYTMGICLEPDRIAIRSPGFRNVPSSHFDSWLYPDPGPLNPCQFFLEQPATAAPGIGSAR